MDTAKSKVCPHGVKNRKIFRAIHNDLLGYMYLAARRFSSEQ